MRNCDHESRSRLSVIAAIISVAIIAFAGGMGGAATYAALTWRAKRRDVPS